MGVYTLLRAAPDAMISPVGLPNDERGAVSETGSYATARGTRTLAHQRLLIRRGQAGWPFVWRGLLPLLALLAILLYALGPFARREIEDNVRRSVTQAFVDQGLPDVQVSVSGQEVLLTGSLKPGVNALDAVSIGRAATCETWLGPQPCAATVVTQFTTRPERAATQAPHRVQVRLLN